MALHYEKTAGSKNTGKSTSAQTTLALLGTPQFFIIMIFIIKLHFSAADDPDDISKAKTFIDNTFNAGARAT